MFYFCYVHSSIFCMKKLNRFLSFFLVLLLFVSSSCSKEEPKTYDIWLPQELKDIFVMKPGTYWIMEAFSDNQVYLDSVFVTEMVFDTLDILHPGSQLPYAAKDRFRVKCFSSFYGREFHLVSETNDQCRNVNFTAPCYNIWVENYSQGILTARSKIFYYPATPDEGWESGNDGSKVRIIEFKDEYKPKDITFKSVWHIETDKDPTLQNTRSFRHISAAEGIIQWRIPQYNVEWITIRSVIIR